MVENDVKEQVDGEKDDDSRAESAAEQQANDDSHAEGTGEQQTNGDDTHHDVMDEVTDNGADAEPAANAEPAADSEPVAEAAPVPAEPAAQNPEKPVEEDTTEQKTEEPERIAATESAENSTNNSV